MESQIEELEEEVTDLRKENVALLDTVGDDTALSDGWDVIALNGPVGKPQV